MLCIVLTYKFGIVIGGKGVGFLAALFVALNPFFAVYSYFVRMEIFMVAPILLAVYLLVRRPSHSLAELLLVGFVLAIGCLFKEFAIVVTGPAAVYVWLTRQASIGRRSLEALAVIAPSILAIGAWGLWVSQTWPHAFVPAVQRWLHSASGGNVNDPRMFIGWIEWSRQLVEDLFRPGLVLALLGALVTKVLLPKTEHAAAEALLWGYLIAALTLSFMMKLREPRHLIALIPIAAILAGQGLMSLSRVARRAPPFVRIGAAVLIITLLVFSTPWQPASVFAGSQAKETLTATYRTRLDGNV
jgi:4-amino-4-deoxy-L-arabinose transferase-like glycosyltransferase